MEQSFNILSESNFQPKILDLTKLSIKYESIRETFSFMQFQKLYLLPLVDVFSSLSKIYSNPKKILILYGINS